MNDEPRARTADEVRDEFLSCVAEHVTYWNTLKDKTTKERLEGLAFSIMAFLDGCAIDLPGFIVSPNPNKDDEEFYKNNGENWYPSDVDIAGGLHEHIHRFFK